MHETYMQRCLDIARTGLGNTSPNPLVGCVIVQNRQIIGEGYHMQCGGPHAEVNAIESVKNKEMLKESTLYVNLEPCAHFGRTPPCSDLIIDHKIPRVVIGCHDSYSKVAGKGISKMRLAGIDVKINILKDESRELNKRFFTYHEKKRPYIILKWAQTLDGFIDHVRDENYNTKPAWITNDLSKSVVHKWRSEEDAIMVGRLTAEKDNPMLNVREWTGQNPVRIVIDQHLKLSHELYLFDQNQKTLVFNGKKNSAVSNIEYVRISFDNDFPGSLLSELYNREIQSLIIEGGELVLSTFLNHKLWDEIRLFVGNKIFNNGVKAPKVKDAELVASGSLDDASLLVFQNK